MSIARRILSPYRNAFADARGVGRGATSNSSCACGSLAVHRSTGCAMPFSASDVVTAVPTIIPNCDNDLVIATSNGVDAMSYIPVFRLREAWNRSLTSSPSDPLRGSDVIDSTGAAEVDILFPTPTGTAPGQRASYLGCVITVSTSALQAPPDMALAVHGWFEDGNEYNFTADIDQGMSQKSRFLLFFTRTVQSTVIPSLILVQSGYELTGPGDAIPLTAGAAPNDATSFTPTNGIRAVQREFSVNLTGGPPSGLLYVDMLTPTSKFSEWASAVINLSEDPASPAVRQ